MAFGQLGVFGKFKLILTIFALVWLFAGSIISIVNASFYYYQTKNYRPLLSETGGKLVGFDSIIDKNLDELKKEGITEEYSSYLKSKILEAVIFFVLSILLFAWIIGGVVGLCGVPPDIKKSFGMKTLFIVSAIFVIVILGTLYRGIILDEWSINPFKGVTNLVKNYDTVLNFGSFTIYNMANSTIPLPPPS